MKKTAFALTAALLLALPAACIHHHGGPGGRGCPNHRDCDCECRHQKDCPKQPDCPKGGAQPDCPQHRPAAPAK